MSFVLFLCPFWESHPNWPIQTSEDLWTDSTAMVDNKDQHLTYISNKNIVCKICFKSFRKKYNARRYVKEVHYKSNSLHATTLQPQENEELSQWEKRVSGDDLQLLVTSKKARTDNHNSDYLKNYLDNGVGVVDSFVSEPCFFRNDILGN